MSFFIYAFSLTHDHSIACKNRRERGFHIHSNAKAAQSMTVPSRPFGDEARLLLFHKLAHAAELIIFEGLLNFLRSIHHERTAADNRLVDRFATHQ
jgi:hypothetical protein